MYYQILNKERLEEYRKIVNWLQSLYARRRELLQTMGLKSVDLSRTRVTSGSKPMSEEERNAIKLEKINREIKENEAKRNVLFDEFETQIKRLPDPKHQFFLREYYVDNTPRKEVIDMIYGEGAHLDAGKIKKFDRLQTAALNSLQKVSKTPFIEVTQQLTIEGLTNDYE
ncbi:MAG: hypothetical protein IKY45_03825 [Clostridia bacterium]|nr:hypothetical protein [Clostridia bacterium]MBR4973575.1 hypothetical protein [Clostridia bacterium]